ncbi:MAG TPA: hypothetical protein VHQ90_26240 [Thermoanaerobaculia bacterium]|nr:hypothetical protein [Thermoanaerobaculia bacterium]
MTNGYEEAKGQRNFLERLGARIPGYRGFQDRELRRDVDRLQREHLSIEVSRLKTVLQSKARDYTDAGQIGMLNAFGRLDRQLDGLSQTIRFSDYGASGLFDPVKIGEPALERLYQFDLSVLDDLAAIDQAAAAVPAPTADRTGAADSAGAALDRVRDLVRALDDKWRQRTQVIGQALRSGTGSSGQGAGG